MSASASAYRDILDGPVHQFIVLANKIGGHVAEQAKHVDLAFKAQLEFVESLANFAKPGEKVLSELLLNTSDNLMAVQKYREERRESPYFNHLSAVSESIGCLGWVVQSPAPTGFVKEMGNAGQYYLNRVMVDWKKKDQVHVEWARAWTQIVEDLAAFVKHFHTTGIVWSGKIVPIVGPGRTAILPSGNSQHQNLIGSTPPPPPPPPVLDLGAMSLESFGVGDERSALFAQINQGEDITKNLKKVTADMQTHKNPTLRTGPAPFKTPTHFESTQQTPILTTKEPVFTRDGKKWLIEYQENNSKLLVDNAEMNNVVYMYKCVGSTLTVKGKVNNIVLDSCKKCSLLFDSVVASIEFVNCQSVQMQVLGFVPTISVDKTDGCQMYLSNGSLNVEIISSKSSEMNIMLPECNGDYTELAVPEQFKTTINGKALKTVCVDSLG